MELTLLTSVQRVLEAVAAFLSASSSCALRLIVPARGLVFKACVSLSSGLESNNEEEDRSCATPTLSNRSGTSHNFEEGHCRGSCLPLCLLLLLALLLIVPAQRTVDQMKLTHPPTLPSRVNLPHAINFRALCGTNLVTLRSKISRQQVFAAACGSCLPVGLLMRCALLLILPAQQPTCEIGLTHPTSLQREAAVVLSASSCCALSSSSLHAALNRIRCVLPPQIPLRRQIPAPKGRN